MSPESVDSPPTCLRCFAVTLTHLLHSSTEMERLECPSCHRRYARRPGRPLTFAWPHPVSLPLYAVLFDADPLARLSHVAHQFLTDKAPDERLSAIEEIELELRDPTQYVRDILDNPQSEESCRAFLHALTVEVRRELARNTD